MGKRPVVRQEIAGKLALHVGKSQADLRREQVAALRAKQAPTMRELMDMLAALWDEVTRDV